MRLRSVLPLAAAVALTAAAPAAAATWSTPAPLDYGSNHPLQGVPGLAANAAYAFAVAPAGGQSSTPVRSVSSTFTNGVFLDPKTLSADIGYAPGSGQLATYAKTRLVGVGTTSAARSRVVYAFGTLTANRGVLGTPRPLGPSTLRGARPTVATNAAGDVAIGYAVCRTADCSRAMVYLAVRRHGTSTVRSVKVMDGSGPLPQVAVAVNERGDALIAWTQASRLYARIRTLGGRLRDRQTVGSVNRGINLRPSVALSKHRGELVAWSTQSVSEGEPSNGSVFAAQARDGSPFIGAKLGDTPALGAGTYVSGAGVRATFDAAGRRLLAWTAVEAGRFVVRSGELIGPANSEAALTDTQLISDPAVDTVLQDQAVAADGRQLLVLSAGARGNDAPSGRTTIRAAQRVAGATGPFTVDQVSSGQDFAFGASAVWLADRAIVAWTTPAQTAVFSQAPIG